MSQATRAPFTAAALLCTGFLVGSHPIVTSHPLLGGLEPGRAEANAAGQPVTAAVCPTVVAPPPIPTRLAALREAELAEAARATAQQHPVVTPAPQVPLAFVQGATHPQIEAMLTELTTTPEGRRHFETWLERRERYADVFAEALARHGLPPELEAVAFVESDLVPTAVSRVGASGLWQFMPETGRAYGLLVEPGYDERRHVVRSTEAAAAYLRDLFDHFGSWELALAAYNSGFGRVQRAVEANAALDFWSLAEIESEIPRMTIRYVTRVLATAHVLRKLETFGFRRPSSARPPSATETVAVPAGAPVWQLARAAGIGEAELRTLNPELIGDTLPDTTKELTVELPRERAERARITLPLLVGNGTTTATGIASIVPTTR